MNSESVRGGSGEMFDQIAPRYDLLNRLMSFGLDQRWRQKLIETHRQIYKGEKTCFLDIATGTADVAIRLAECYPDASVVGLDPSAEMLRIGREKVVQEGLDDRIDLVEGSALALPFEDNSFQGCTIAFGIRNVPDRLRGLREMTRITEAGGLVSILELCEPESGAFATLARFHMHHIIPRMGAWLSGAKAYRYLQSSIEAFPPPEQFATLMCDAGLIEVHAQRLSFGAATLFTGRAS